MKKKKQQKDNKLRSREINKKKRRKNTDKNQSSMKMNSQPSVDRSKAVDIFFYIYLSIISNSNIILILLDLFE